MLIACSARAITRYQLQRHLISPFCKYSSQSEDYLKIELKERVEAARDGVVKQKKPNPITKHAIGFVVFSGLSFLFAAYTVGADNPELLIAKLDTHIAPIYMDDPEDAKNTLEIFAQYTQTNDTLKRLIIDKKHVDKVLHLVETGQTPEIRNFAAKIIDNLVQDDSNKHALLADFSRVQKMVAIARDKEASLYVRKALAHALACCATEEGLHNTLAVAGVPTALYEVQQEPLLKRRIFDLAVQQIAMTVMEKGGTSGFIGEGDLQVLQNAYAVHGKTQNSLFGQIQLALVNSGVTMYLHTSVGGFIWGSIESLRARASIQQILVNAFKTSLVTGLVPICFVGLGVSLYTYYQHRVDTAEQRFYLTLGTCISLYPWYYLMPVVERFSPFWIGGHVLGFMSFFYLDGNIRE
jgi:hypothetical protein